MTFEDAVKKLQRDAGNAQSELPQRQIINYKPAFQWVKFRVAYNGIAQHSTEVTAILNAYKVYAENKHKAKRVSA